MGSFELLKRERLDEESSPYATADRGQYKIIAYVLAMLCHI
jgi:hypothetical protein